MRIGAFEIAEPVPELSEPHALAVIPSWMDAGVSASMTLSLLGKNFEAKELARLARPGEFFDFTRSRPVLSGKGDEAVLTLTTAVATYAKGEESDFIFLRLPEPNTMAEVYIDSVLDLLKSFGVKRYGLLGSIYDMVPYTRPLLVTGSGSSEGLKNSLSAASVVASDYEGPTTILYLLGQQMLQLGAETFTALVHLPGYLNPENDYRGENRLLEVMESLYGLPVPQETAEKAQEQQEQVSLAAEQLLQQQPHLRVVLKQLEENYDARVSEQKKEIRLSPEVEKFLKELNGRFEQG